MANNNQITESNEKLLSFNEDELRTIRNTVAKDANESEFKMFITLASRYGLDPFNKEIFFWKVKGRPTIMTSRDGYLKIADRHPEYDGLVSDVVRGNDQFKRISDGIDHQYSSNRGDIIGAYALVYRKDRSYPIYIFAPFDEYNASSRVWNQYPSAMILKVAESMSLKRSFSISGLVSREEMEVTQMQDDSSSFNSEIDSVEVVSEDNSITSKSIKEELTEKETEIKKLVSNNSEVRKELYDYLSFIKEKRELDKISINDLSDDEFVELKELLQYIKKCWISQLRRSY